MNTTAKQQTKRTPGFACVLTPEMELQGATIIAEYEDGSYAPVNRPISISEALEILPAFHPAQHNGKPVKRYVVWAMSCDGYSVAAILTPNGKRVTVEIPEAK